MLVKKYVKILRTRDLHEKLLPGRAVPQVSYMSEGDAEIVRNAHGERVVNISTCMDMLRSNAKPA